MARRVFFSFHYDRDIWRVNQIRNIGEIVGVAAAGFQDASLWEEAKTKGDKVIKALIDNGLANTSVTVVCIGAKSAGRKYIDYEIEQSIARENGIVALRINHLKDRFGEADPVGATPQAIVAAGIPIRTYVDHATLKKWIDEAAG